MHRVPFIQSFNEDVTLGSTVKKIRTCAASGVAFLGRFLQLTEGLHERGVLDCESQMMVAVHHATSVATHFCFVWV